MMPLTEDDPEALYRLAEALRETNEEEARVLFVQAAKAQHALTLAHPDHARHHARLGELLSAADMDGCWEAFYDAALIDPELSEAHDWLCCDQDGEFELIFLDGARQLKAGRWQAAAEIFQKMLDERPVHRGALCGLGTAAWQLGSTTTARQAFERAQALSPHWARPRQALAALG